MEFYRCGLCQIHPRDSAVGVCAACLTERLLVIAAKQRSSGAFNRVPSLKPKVFAMGTSLLHLIESGDENANIGEDCSSADDSFISIKFEESGKVCWDKKAELRGGGRECPRWRKRVLHLLHFVGWRTHSKKRH